MISNIPKRRLNEKFIVYTDNTNGNNFYQIENSNGFVVTNFYIPDKSHLECLLEEVLTRGIEQGKQEVRLALGLKE